MLKYICGMETQEQKLKDILRKHTFDAIVPDLITLDEQVEDNLYAFKEAFDDLLRMMPGDPHGEKIEVSTVIDTDDDGNEINRYLHASNCEAAPWDECLAKEVIFEDGITETHALARILWHMTFNGFTPGRELYPDRSIHNKFEQQAEDLRRRQFLNYAKGIACPFEVEHMCLSMEGWDMTFTSSSYSIPNDPVRDIIEKTYHPLRIL